MTYTGPGPTTATGTSPMHTIFQPKNIMGSLVQMKFDTHVASNEIQCGATFGHALARISPSRVRPPVMCTYSIGES